MFFTVRRYAHRLDDAILFFFFVYSRFYVIPERVPCIWQQLSRCATFPPSSSSPLVVLSSLSLSLTLYFGLRGFYLSTLYHRLCIISRYLSISLHAFVPPPVSVPNNIALSFSRVVAAACPDDARVRSIAAATTNIMSIWLSSCILFSRLVLFCTLYPFVRRPTARRSRGISIARSAPPTCYAVRTQTLPTHTHFPKLYIKRSMVIADTRVHCRCERVFSVSVLRTNHPGYCSNRPIFAPRSHYKIL